MSDLATPVRGPRRKSDLLLVALVVAAIVLGAAVLLREKGDGGADEEALPAATVGSCKGRDRLTIPSQKVTAPLVAIQTVKRDGATQLDPPEDPDVVGWWDLSAQPGTTTGQTLITGHTVQDGDGALDHIGKLRKGKPVKVCFRGRLVTYRTTKVFELTKEQVAAQAQQLFGQQRKDGRLVLVTCTDWIGPGNYRSNLIVFGEPLATI